MKSASDTLYDLAMQKISQILTGSHHVELSTSEFKHTKENLAMSELGSCQPRLHMIRCQLYIVDCLSFKWSLGETQSRGVHMIFSLNDSGEQEHILPTTQKL